MQDELRFDEEILNDTLQVFRFENGFIETEKFSYLKIVAVHLIYDTLIGKETWASDGMEFTQAILKNVRTGEMKFIKINYNHFS